MFVGEGFPRNHNKGGTTRTAMSGPSALGGRESLLGSGGACSLKSDVTGSIPVRPTNDFCHGYAVIKY